MAMKGEGPMAVGLMWMMTAIALIFVVLRVYARLIVVKSYGMDDHVYVFAFILLLLYTIFITLSAQRGFGQNMFDIPDPNDISSAVLLEAIGQIFAVLGMAVAKWSLGLFLLRLVTKTYHRAIIWVVMLVLMGASIALIFCFMLQCTPPEFLWDRTIPGGKCTVPMMPVSIVYATACVFTDLFFALFPWVFIWGLQMNKREKLVILASMSLGIFAGAFGLKRAVEIPSLMDPNYLRATVGIILWSAAEQCVTMVCIGVPVCRPLYKSYLDKWTTYRSRGYKGYSGYQKQSKSADGGSMALRTFGSSKVQNPPSHSGVDDEDTQSLRDHGFSAPNARPYTARTASMAKADTLSEEMLQTQLRRQSSAEPPRIHVTNQYSVTRS